MDLVCREYGIEHRLTKPYQPWDCEHQRITQWVIRPRNGRADRMSRTIEDATSKAFHHPSLDALRAYVLAFVAPYNVAKHLKALRWRTPFQGICEAWQHDAFPFNLDPHRPIPGPNI